MNWIEALMWAYYRFAGNAMTTVGFYGLLLMAGMGLWRLSERLVDGG